MQTWFMDISNIWMVPIYPLLAFLLIVFIRSMNRLGPSAGQGLLARKEIAMALTVLATFLGLLHALGALNWFLGENHSPAIEKNWVWLSAGAFRLSVGYLLDAMSVMMLFVVTFISMLIQIYTHGYMDHDKGYAKFYAYLALFNFSMLGLVLSTNLFQIYIFWELVGVSSYLLIGFWFTRPSAAAAAVKAFLMNRVGDFGFLIGILALLFYTFSAWQPQLQMHPEQGLLSFTALGDVAHAAFDPLIDSTATQPAALLALGAICFLLFMGPMAKSAQVPLHTWLPDAMEGPTPISALIHAATMVAAGVFLIGRIYPVLTLSDSALPIIAAVGTTTALIGATIALVQTDIKKALAYSTMSQLGYMVAAMGVGAFGAALFHLFTHAFFKALLFLCSGSVIHACEDEQDMRKMGGLMSKLPVTGWTYLIGTLAIAGFPLTSGFFSKDMIIAGASAYDPIVYFNLVLTAGLTAFYMFRTYFLTFTGKYRGEAHVHHENPWMVTPLAILAVPSLLIGWLLSGYGPEWAPNFTHYLHYDFIPPGAHPVHHPHTLQELLFSNVALTSTIVSLGGIAVAWYFYGTEAGKVWPERIRTAPILRNWNIMFQRKWYFDDIYQAFVDRVYLAFAGGSARFDRNVIDGLVNWSARTVRGSGYLMAQLQSGRVQTYIAVMFFGLVVLALLMYYWLI